MAYWLSLFILSSGLEDGLNSYISPLTILLVNGEKVELVPIYLRSLYTFLDECIVNVAWLLGH